MSSRRALFGFAAALVFASAACGPSPSTVDAGDASGRWPCPDGWVASSVGGCGPAVMLCAPDGGAAPSACDGIAIDHPVPVTDEDGGVGSTFYVLPDGGIGGAWIAPTSEAGPPAADWAPDAGIPSCPEDHQWIRDGENTCDAQMRADCPAGSAPLPGRRCTPTAAADCPSTPFADVSAETTSAVYVLAGADPATADGTMAHPDATIAAGIARAGAGGWVLVGAGRYAESIAVTASVHVVGLCAASTIVAPSAGAHAFDVSGAGAHLDLRGVHSRGGAGIVVQSGAVASIERVFVENASPEGVLATGAGADLTIRESSIVGTVSGSTEGAVGLDAQNGATVTATGVAVTDTRAANSRTQSFSVVSEAATLTIRDSYVRGAATTTAGGPGLYVGRRGRIDAQRMVVEHNTADGVMAYGTNSTANISDSIVRDTLGVSLGGGDHYGSGLEAANGGVVVADRVLVDRNVGRGVRGYTAPERGTPAAHMTLRDSVVRNTESYSDGTQGFGVTVSIGATVADIERCIIENNREAGIGSSGQGIDTLQPVPTTTVTDTIVRGTRENAAGEFGWGVEADYGAAMNLTRMRIEDNVGIGVGSLSGGDNVVTISDSVIVQSAQPGSRESRGLDTQCHASLSVARVRVVGAAGVGIFAGDACPSTDGLGEVTPGLTTLGVQDSIIEGTRSVTGASNFGAAILVIGGAAANLERIAVLDSEAFGVVTANSGTTLSWHDGAIFGTRSLGDGRFGGGLIADDFAAVNASRLAIDHAAEFGVLAIDGATIDVSDALVLDVTSSSRGGGMGIAAAVGGTIGAQRVAISNSTGAGLGSLTGDQTRPEVASAAHVTASDLYVRSVRAGQLANGAPPLAYGLHAAESSTLEATRAVIAGADYGFFNASGTLRIEEGSVTGQRTAFGASRGSSLVLVDVRNADNSNAAVLNDVTLPSGSGLAPPPLPAGCSASGCD